MDDIRHQFESIKKSLNEESLTVMIIPGANKNVRNYSFKYSKLVQYAAVTTAITSLLLVSSIGFSVKSGYLVSENKSLQTKLLTQETIISDLQTINSKNSDEIKILSLKLAENENIYQSRLENIDELEKQVQSLVAMLNSEKNLSIKIPTSRSFDRNNDSIMASPSGYDYINTPLGTEDDSVVELIKQQTEEYAQLINEIEGKLKYIECKPDLMPANGTITSGFGTRKDPITNKLTMHTGIDIAASVGTAVHAAGDGVVTYSGYSGDYGKMVIISHGFGYETVYAHNSKNLVEVGEKVKKGTKISEIGRTGKTTGSHVHFEIHYNSKQINPKNVLNLK